MPPKSSETTNEILSPSILPFLMAMSPPSGPVVVPVSVPPSALKLKPTFTVPMGVSSDPAHLPSTSAARAGAATSTRAHITNSENRAFFIRSLLLLEQIEIDRSGHRLIAGVVHVQV